MATTTKTTRITNRIKGTNTKGNGAGAPAVAKVSKTKVSKTIVIPPLQQSAMDLWLIGDRPLLVNNKLNIAEALAEKYSGPGGKGAHVPKAPDPTPDQQYAMAFYVMPDSKQPAPHKGGKYGVPTSGIKKCVCAAIRTTGITDNTTIGLISNSFWVMEDGGGLCAIQFKRVERDVRSVNIGSGQKTVPQMRHRPMFHDWRIKIRLKFNSRVMSEEQLVNLFMHAGQYIGLCELRAQKKQGQCGGFTVKGVK